MPLLSRVKDRIRENFTGDKRIYIYENIEVFPRFFLVDTVRYFDNKSDLFNALGNANTKELRRTVFIEKEFINDVGKREFGFSDFNINLEKYSPDHIKLTVNVDGSSILVVSNSYSRFWNVRVNGTKRSIFPAYGAFWCVALESGLNKVHFSYEPPYALFTNKPTLK